MKKRKSKVKNKKTVKKRKENRIKKEIKPDFEALFEGGPSAYLVLMPDKNFTIVAVSESYNKATMTKKNAIIGRALFNVFPDNPDDPNADGARNLRASLLRVLRYNRPDTMQVQKYDIPRPVKDGGGFEVRYWEPLNTPVLNKKGKLKYIIHSVTDVTEMVILRDKTGKQQTPQTKTQKTLEDKLSEKTSADKRYRELVEGVKDYAIYTIDTKGYVTSWNKGAELIKGYKADEIIGKHISTFYTAEEIERKEPWLNLERAVKYGKYETEGWRVCKNRTVFWANVVYTPLFDELGNHKGFTKITRNLTEKKKAEEQLKNSNIFLDSVLENLPNMVFVKDAKELRFIRFNKAGEQLLGFSQMDLLGKNDYDFFPKEQADFFISKDRAVLEGDGIVDIPEEEIDTRNGKRWLHTRKIAIKDVDDKPIYLLGISEDITEKRKATEKISMLNVELKQNNAQLEAVNKELDAFSYSVSHDLRAPLRAIHGYSKILLEDHSGRLEEDAKNMMQAVMSNAVKMGRLIDDLLAFSRMGKKEMNIVPVDMTEIACSALQQIKSSYPGGLIKANITLSPLLPCSADYSLIMQVFTNLISNAIKYSAKTEKPIIEINSYYKDGENVYYIKDNGVGFDMKYYDKLFGVFQRLHGSSEFEGTGVGLALVKRIITRHGGRVWAEGEPNNGATFYVSLYKTPNN